MYILCKQSVGVRLTELQQTVSLDLALSIHNKQQQY
jgi:hypothetical protein